MGTDPKALPSLITSDSEVDVTGGWKPLPDALTALRTHIASERLRDVDFDLKKMRMTSAGRLTTRHSDPGVAYTRRALQHIAELALCPRPRFWVANLVYLAPFRRPYGLAELVERAEPRTLLVGRIAWDAEGATDYLRAVVSDRHAAAAGDDLALATVLEDIVPASFLGAPCKILRGPDVSTISTLLDSLQTAVSVRRSLRVINSETKACRFGAFSGLHFMATDSGVALPMGSGFDSTSTSARHIARGDVALMMAQETEAAMLQVGSLAALITDRTDASTAPFDRRALAFALSRRILPERDTEESDTVGSAKENQEGPSKIETRLAQQLGDDDAASKSGIALIPVNTIIRAVAALSVVAKAYKGRIRHSIELAAGTLLVHGFGPGELNRAAEAVSERDVEAEAA